jgi:hypothetical protein
MSEKTISRYCPFKELGKGMRISINKKEDERDSGLRIEVNF